MYKLYRELQTNQKRLRRENYKMHNLYIQINHVSNKDNKNENYNEKKNVISTKFFVYTCPKKLNP